MSQLCNNAMQFPPTCWPTSVLCQSTFDASGHKNTLKCKLYTVLYSVQYSALYSTVYSALFNACVECTVQCSAVHYAAQCV